MPLVRHAAIGRLRTNARGFHDPQACMAMVMLDRAGIGPRRNNAISGFPV